MMEHEELKPNAEGEKEQEGEKTGTSNCRETV